MPIKFSPCATNPCVTAEPWTRPDQAVARHKPPSHAPDLCTWLCVRAVHNKYANHAPNRAVRPSESCKTNIRAEPHEPPRRAPVQAIVTNRRAEHPSRASRTAEPCICPRTRQCTRPCIRSTHALGHAHARHAHSAVQTREHSAMHTLDTHSLAQVALNILCSTLSDINNMFCFCLYTSRLPAGLTMWDNSQFLFFFIFSSTFILT